MAFSYRTAVTVSPLTHHFSPHILERFGNPLDSLTAHLMLECAEVLAGVKPANLISLVNRTRPCGRNLYGLWQCHHGELSACLDGIDFIVLQTRERALLLCYDRGHLEGHLSHAGIRTLLHKAGYTAEAYRCSRAVMENQLAECDSLFDCLDNICATGKHFFCAAVDKECHFQESTASQETHPKGENWR